MNGEPILGNVRQALSTGTSLRGIAERAGISHSTLSRILRGQRQPSKRTLGRLKGAIGEKSAVKVVLVLLVTTIIIWLFFRFFAANKKGPTNHRTGDNLSS